MSGIDDGARRIDGRPGPRRVNGESGGESDPGSDALGAALRALPAEAASSGFTARLLARLDDGERASRRAAGVSFRRPAAAWASLVAAALAVAVAVAVVRSGGPPAHGPDRVAGIPPVEAPGERSPAAPGAAAGDPGGEAVPRAASGVGEPVATADREPVGDEPATSSAAAASPGTPVADPRDSLAGLRAELDALRREHRRFEIGLADLPEVGPNGQPMVYLGGDEGLGLVLDLGRESVRSGDPAPGQGSGTSL